MSTITNLNIRTEKETKDDAERIYKELGFNMTTAVNMFLKASIRANGLPFTLQLDIPNDETAAAIEEGRRIARDKNVKGYKSIKELRTALES